MIPDIRQAVRGLRQQPGFAVLAIIIVALGAGANATIFSVVRAVLIEPLPFTRPDRLVTVAPAGFISNADVQFLRARAHVFATVASSSPGWTMSMIGAGDPLRVTATKTSANLFDVLGAKAHLGRVFVEGEDIPGRHRVAVLSYALWQSRFGADTTVIGRVITLEDAPHQIIGVMAPDFEVLGRDAELWMPLPFDPASPFWKGTVAQGIARLRDGVDVNAANRELQSLLPDWRRDVGYERDWGAQMIAAPLREVALGDVRRSLLVLTGAVLLVVVLTAANVGTLLLSRQVARRRESAVRAALGASMWRLATDAAVESLVLAVAGTLAGLAIAWLTLPVLVSLLPPEMPRLAAIRVNGAVLGTVLATSALAVLTFGVLPAVFAVRPELQPLLRIGAQSQPRAARRSLDALVVTQVSLAVVLGVAAALMGQSLLALQRVDPGFDPAHVLTLKLQPSRRRAPDRQRAAAYYDAMIAQVGALAGVTHVGAINHLPLSGYNWVTTIKRDDRPLPPGVSAPTAGWRMIEGPYFESMKIPLLAGRSFDEHDGSTSSAVAIVNEAFATKFFGSVNDALGRSVRTGSARGEEAPTIVGIVGNVRHVALAREPAPELYRPIGQSFPIAMALTVRTIGAPGAIAAAVRQAVWAVDPTVPIADMTPLQTQLRESLGRPRLLAFLLVVFAATGLAILLTGVYGVVAYTTERRGRELAIRLALGAAPRSVAKLVVRQGLVYAAAGLALGMPVAFAATRVLRGLLFGIEPRDPATFAALSLLITAATLVATIAPAHRAWRLDPVATLNRE